MERIYNKPISLASKAYKRTARKLAIRLIRISGVKRPAKPSAEELLAQVAAQNPELIIAKAIELDPERVASEAIYRMAIMEKTPTSYQEFFDFTNTKINNITRKGCKEIDKKYWDYKEKNGLLAPVPESSIWTKKDQKRYEQGYRPFLEIKKP